MYVCLCVARHFARRHRPGLAAAAVAAGWHCATSEFGNGKQPNRTTTTRREFSKPKPLVVCASTQLHWHGVRHFCHLPHANANRLRSVFAEKLYKFNERTTSHQQLAACNRQQMVKRCLCNLTVFALPFFGKCICSGN